MLLLAILLPALIDPALCRQRSSGPARWETDGKGTITVSTEARFTGEVIMRCRVPVPDAASEVKVELDHTGISFQPAGSREIGSGVVLEAEGSRIEILRVAGEDWIQTPHRAMVVPVRERHVGLTVRLIDNSPLLPVRVDIRHLRVSAIDKH